MTLKPGAFAGVIYFWCDVFSVARYFRRDILGHIPKVLPVSSRHIRYSFATMCLSKLVVELWGVGGCKAKFELSSSLLYSLNGSSKSYEKESFSKDDPKMYHTKNFHTRMSVKMFG